MRNIKGTLHSIEELLPPQEITKERPTVCKGQVLLVTGNPPLETIAAGVLINGSKSIVAVTKKDGEWQMAHYFVTSGEAEEVILKALRKATGENLEF